MIVNIMKTDDIRITPKWEKSKEQIWAEKFEFLEETQNTKIIPLYRRKIWLYVAAAVILIMLALPTTAFLYTKDVYAAYGEHKSVTLPDGSRVELNADSHLKYKPLWWMVSRSAELQGEAYFEVQKGSRFTIHSADKTVAVLGTSFNIYARDENYNVDCLTGKVEVSDNSQSVILTAGTYTSFINGKFTTAAQTNNNQSVGWTKGEFSFTAIPLTEVLKEIERQYNIKIEKPKNSDYFYTGTFSKKDSPKEVLEIIEKPFGIKLNIIE